MKKLVGFLVVLLLAADAMAQGWEWAETPTCSSPGDGSEGWLVKTDDSGNVYAGGYNLGDSICIGPNKFYLPISNASQALLLKYDLSGNLIWAKASTNGSAYFTDFTFDKAGNIYTYGYFYSDSVRFGNVTLLNPVYDYGNPYPWVNVCAFVAKYNPAGDVIWAKNSKTNVDRLSDGFGFSIGGIGADDASNIYIGGRFTDSLFVFETDTLVNTVAGQADIFLSKFDSSGQILWTKSFGGSYDESIVGLVVNSQNEILVAGDFNSSNLVFDTVSLHYQGHPAGNSWYNAFLSKFDSSGNVVWAKSCIGNAIAYKVAVDTLGNIYLGGASRDSLLVFNGDTLKMPYQRRGAFLTKYEETGSVLWAKSLSPTNALGNGLAVYGITIDPCNNVWICGRLEQTSGLILDSATIMYAPSPGLDPFFLVQYTSLGTLLDHLALTSGGDDNSGIASDDSGNIYLCGDYYYYDPFVIGNDSLHFYNGESENLFVAKYKPTTICNIPETVNVTTNNLMN